MIVIHPGYGKVFVAGPNTIKVAAEYATFLATAYLKDHQPQCLPVPGNGFGNADIMFQFSNFNDENERVHHVLPLAMALIGAILRKTPIATHVFLGDVDEAGDLLPFEEDGEVFHKRLLTMDKAKAVVLPKANEKAMRDLTKNGEASEEVRKGRIRVIGVETLKQAVDKYLK